MVRRERRPASPFERLGLSESADRRAVLAARRRLAKSVHPDHGGDVSRMQRINDATTAALDAIERRAEPSPRGREARPTPPPAPAGRPSMAPRPAGSRVVDDIPSFVVEALPAVAFDVLETVAPLLGTVADSEPPYLLDVELEGALRCLCRLELLPEAGSTSVGMVLVGLDGGHPPETDAVRDAWIAAINAAESAPS